MSPHTFSHAQILQLSYVKGITASGLRKIVEHYGNAERLAHSTPDFFAQARVRGLQFEALQGYINYEEFAQRQIASAERHGARIVTIWDDEYPAALREIYNPPTVIFVKGTLLSEDAHAIAIVGTRGMTEYGRRMTEVFARSFVEHGVTVVSGLARGVDSVAHGAALKYNGRTIAVVASGLDEISPQIAKQLSDKIIHNGAVISEYKMGIKAMPAFFPQRNRIISGIALGTVVVESAVDGGAMITAGFALDQNRGTFAIPGRTNDPKSTGTNLLIKDSRAKLVTVPEDVLQEFGIAQKKDNAKASALNIENISLFERKVFDSLADNPKHIDEIAETSAIPSSEALVHLLSLELKGYVRQMAGKMFARE